MADAPRIRVLTDDVVNQIAAGEVIERPAAAVKELIENALDAGATQVDVEVAAGGRRLLSVADNGCGMDRDDALLACERHATSKIRSSTDIDRVVTLGFRGEALAALAAVSQFTLTTRKPEALSGTEVILAGGRVREVREVGCPPGTRVQARQLFYNVPARRKFLRSDMTELAHIRHVFTMYALAHPSCGFRLEVDGRELHRLPAGAGLVDRIRDLFGEEVAALMRPVDFRTKDLAVTGYAGLPAAGRSDRSGQFLFVNGRPASAPVLHYSISEAYRTALPKDRHAVLFLNLDLDSARVDVNVHPAKKEVRFLDSGAVRDAVIRALLQTLNVHPPVGSPPVASAQGAHASPPAQTTPRWTPEAARPLTGFVYPRPPLAAISATPAAAVTPPDATEPTPTAAAALPWTGARILGQIGGLYVLLETENGLVLMDPHAAHERVLYEHLMRQTLARRPQRQGLLTPETLSLAPRAAATVRENLESLREMGFGISEFGGDAFLVDALPACLGGVSAASVLQAVAETLDQAGTRGGRARWSTEAVAQAACKAAVKAHDPLSLEEIGRLADDLGQTEMPYTCPHGRPTVIFLSYSELARKFGRSLKKRTRVRAQESDFALLHERLNRPFCNAFAHPASGPPRRFAEACGTVRAGAAAHARGLGGCLRRGVDSAWPEGHIDQVRPARSG